MYCYAVDLVRLACVKHAASVRPEPGSNSPTKPCSDPPPEGSEPEPIVLEPECLTGEYPWLVALRADLLICHEFGNPWTCELTRQRPAPARRLPSVAARIGVQSSLLFSRSQGTLESLTTNWRTCSTARSCWSCWCRCSGGVNARPERDTKLPHLVAGINLSRKLFRWQSRACPCAGGENTL